MSIVMRIYLGMGAMIALIMAVGGFAAFQTNTLANTFVEYRATAKTSLQSGRMIEDLFDARIASLKFRATEDTAEITRLSGDISEIRAIQIDLYELLEGYPEQDNLALITELLEEYETAMGQAYSLQQQRDTLVEQTTATGLKARRQLSEVMETALQDDDALASSMAGLAATNLLLGRLYLERFLVSNNPEHVARSTTEFETARISLTQLMQELQSPRRRELTQATLADLDNFDTAVRELSDVIETRNAYYKRVDDIGPEALSHMKTAIDAIVARQNTLGPEGSTLAKRSIWIVSVFMVAGTLIGGLLAFFTSRIISTQLTRMTEDMSELAEGNLDIDIAPSEHNHEIGKMTNAMVVFLDHARTARDLDAKVKEKEKLERMRETEERAREAERAKEQQEAEQLEREAERARMKTLENFQNDMENVLGDAASGNFSNRMATGLEDKSLVDLANVINRLLDATDTNIKDIVTSIGELAQGNLGIRIEGDREGAFLEMKNDFNAALFTLSKTMERVMHSGQSVSSTSSELETSALSMAKRAEDSAAAVEETSAAVEEITASIRQVVSNAKAADEATSRVRVNADKTRQVSNDTETSITAMTEASAQINRVVKVIEDIAFQINLLALNAGVEAARAGDAGRGFSVVASEVRGLAKRSQEAVQEISSVIEKNNQTVEAGVEQVALSRKALESIISEVEVASGQITDIAAAVEQQSLGIEEVNTAIQSIDSTAQSNAATLEEMTASSVSLNEEASRLGEALQQFHGIPPSMNSPDRSEVIPFDNTASGSSYNKPKTVAAGSLAVKESWEEF